MFYRWLCSISFPGGNQVGWWVKYVRNPTFFLAHPLVVPPVPCVVPRVPCVVPLVPCAVPLVPCVVPLVPCVVPLVPCAVPLAPCVVPPRSAMVFAVCKFCSLRRSIHCAQEPQRATVCVHTWTVVINRSVMSLLRRCKVRDLPSVYSHVNAPRSPAQHPYNPRPQALTGWLGCGRHTYRIPSYSGSTAFCA